MPRACRAKGKVKRDHLQQKPKLSFHRTKLIFWQFNHLLGQNLMVFIEDNRILRLKALFYRINIQEKVIWCTKNQEYMTKEQVELAL